MIPDDEHSMEFIPKENNIDEKDQRRLTLLNDPNYGIILCFLERFRSSLDLPLYSYQRLEDHLIQYQDQIPPRLIDFHFILLKRLSLAKNTQREKFNTIITKFASRFDFNDADSLTTTGYLQVDITIKIRILKNLLEGQFDLNQTFKNTLVDKSAREIKSIPIGRDRFGVSYWLFMDTDCFVRLFREDIDLERTWSHVAKNREEFENFIKLLITDSVVRNKFADWTIDYEAFAALSLSNEYEERYLPSTVKDEEEEEEEDEDKHQQQQQQEMEESEIIESSTVIENETTKKRRGWPKGLSIANGKDQNDTEVKEEVNGTSSDDEPVKKKRGRARRVSQVPEIKHEEDEKSLEPIKKKCGRAKSLAKPSLSIDANKIHQEIKQEPEQSETAEVCTQRKSGRLRTSIKQVNTKIKTEEVKPTSNDDAEWDLPLTRRSTRPRKPVNKEIKPIDMDIKEEEEEVVTPSRRGRKRKTPVEENQHDDQVKLANGNNMQHEQSSDDNTAVTIRRSTRTRKATVPDSTINSQITNGKKKRSMNGKSKASHEPSTTQKSDRSRRRRKVTSRRNFDDEFCLSSSTSDDHLDYESDYNSDDYLPNPAELEHDENFFELDEDNNPTGEELRTAKTAQASTVIIACRVCSKSDRPEVLLLCDDCDDAYHLECLRPKLLSVPDGDWFCPLCEHRKLSNCLLEKLKGLLINFNQMETKRLERESKKVLERKLRPKEYASDESVTASESELENLAENNLYGDESMLSINQVNENSNLSSTHFDDSSKNISQRGRHRRTRFDMNKMLNNDDDSDENKSDTDEDDEYVEASTQITNFDVQIPKKMTRLFNQRYRPIARNDQQIKPKPIAPRLYPTSVNLNEKLGSPIIYVNGDGTSHQIRSVITNSNQTLKIVRRWNDVQRRNRLRTNNTKLLNDTTSDCADENSVFCPDDGSPPRSNDSNSNCDLRDEDSTIIRSKITLTQPASLVPVYKNSTKNVVRKNEVNFDRLTRDIQYAVSEANTLSTVPKAVDQQRTQKTNFSPYFTNVALRPLPVILPKPAGVGYKIFKSKDPPTSTSITNINTTTASTDLSNIILTPSSSSSLLDGNDDQSTAPMNT
ncbi:unnamed protein product [Adineta ricciae]|uniref:PHD-type domain-containing protein n=1 Tax=Adineta ricciae TaxID=249248 RepID=A0A813Z1L1_ADIRI|nr:unnamed protein product [Adineta ricciae]CAF1180350.1 unnamed protein product [Adineta ricciae]